MSISLLAALVDNFFASSNCSLYFLSKILGIGGPSVVSGFPEFYFDGNQPHSKVVSELKDNFLNFVQGPFIPPWYCQTLSDCRRDNVHAYM